MAAAPATPVNASASTSPSMSARMGRRLQMDFDASMYDLRSKLDINQTHLLGTTDLDAYDPYAAVATGHDFCMASALMARGVQAQATLLQSGTVQNHVNAGQSFTASAALSIRFVAGVINSYGFASLGEPSVLDSTLLASATGVNTTLLSQAMATSYQFIDGVVPSCPPLDAWESAILTSHNSKRALHCAAPIVWDASLAEAAGAWAKTCPSEMDSHSSAANENVVMSATPSNDPAIAAPELFDLWYAAQLNNYDGKYTTAVGPCDGGFNFSTPDGYDCVPDSSSTRVREFTQIVWQGHEKMGCAFSQCSFGNVLVCQYGPKSGNTVGDFQANVAPISPSGPGPCGERTWPYVVALSKAAHVAQSGVTVAIEKFLNGSIDESTFVAMTSLGALIDLANKTNIPLMAPMPPSPPPPPANIPTFPPYPPLETGVSSQTASQTASDSGDSSWVFAVVLAICLPLLLCCIGCIVLYRVSGGEPGVWATVHYTHTNPKIALLYTPDEKRAQAAGDLAIYQKAMSDAMGAYSNSIVGYLNMRRDHLNFVKAGGLVQARSGDADYEPPYAEKADKEDVGEALAPAAQLQEEEPPADPAPVKVLPDQPQIDAELDQEFAESPEDRVRRLEWIKYFVREGDLQRAFDLGWDGKPFQQAQVLPPESADSTTTSKPSKPTSEVPAAAPATSTRPGKGPAPPPEEDTAAGVGIPLSDGGGASSSGGEAGPSTVEEGALHRI